MLKLVLITLCGILTGCESGLLRAEIASLGVDVPPIREIPRSSTSNRFDPCRLNTVEGRQSLRLALNYFEGVDISDPRPDPSEMLIKRLKRCDRKVVADSLIEMTADFPDDLELKSKAAYLMIKFGSDKLTNFSELVDIFDNFKELRARTEGFSRGDVITYIGWALVENDPKGDLLDHAFRSLRNVDGGYLMELSGAYAKVFRRSPMLFLEKASVLDVERLEAVFVPTCEPIGTKRLLRKLKRFENDPKLRDVARQVVIIVDSDPFCKDF